MPLTPGSTFERYEIGRLVGRGGMGEVYQAIDTRLHRTVALKVLRTDEQGAASVIEAGGVARLLREARAAAALNHANSVAIYELGEAEGIAYIAMEFVTGVSFRKYIGDANVSLSTKVSWLVDAARALWAAHRAGLVHRDVKPGNIMVSEEGVVKVLDFGLAKPIEMSASPIGFQTKMGQVLGTPRYMAPEQLEGSPANAAADQFGFGITAYELISGIYPGGPLAGTPPPLEENTRGVTAELAATVRQMMARRPRDRFATMEEAAHALRTCVPSLGSIVAGRQPTPRPQVAEVPAPPSQNELLTATDVSLVQDKSKTLPLGASAYAAVGAVMGASRSAPPQATRGGALERTLPLSGRPKYIAAAPPSSGNVNVSSGVYASRARAEGAAAPPSQPTPSSRSIESARAPQRSMVGVLFFVFIAVAIASGALAAWLLR